MNAASPLKTAVMQGCSFSKPLANKEDVRLYQKNCVTDLATDNNSFGKNITSPVLFWQLSFVQKNLQEKSFGFLYASQFLCNRAIFLPLVFDLNQHNAFYISSHFFILTMSASVFVSKHGISILSPTYVRLYYLMLNSFLLYFLECCLCWGGRKSGLTML